MNRKRLQEFSNYLEGFTQRIVQRFPDSTNFIQEEKCQMLERYPELAGVNELQQSQDQTIEVINEMNNSSHVLHVYRNEMNNSSHVLHVSDVT